MKRKMQVGEALELRAALKMLPADTEFDCSYPAGITIRRLKEVAEQHEDQQKAWLKEYGVSDGQGGYRTKEGGKEVEFKSPADEQKFERANADFLRREVEVSVYAMKKEALPKKLGAHVMSCLLWLVEDVEVDADGDTPAEPKPEKAPK